MFLNVKPGLINARPNLVSQFSRVCVCKRTDSSVRTVRTSLTRKPLPIIQSSSLSGSRFIIPFVRSLARSIGVSSGMTQNIDCSGESLSPSLSSPSSSLPSTPSAVISRCCRLKDVWVAGKWDVRGRQRERERESGLRFTTRRGGGGEDETRWTVPPPPGHSESESEPHATCHRYRAQQRHQPRCCSVASSSDDVVARMFQALKV